MSFVKNERASSGVKSEKIKNTSATANAAKTEALITFACLLESFADEEFTDEETECALLFVDYIKKNLPQYLPRAEKLLDLFYRNQEECRKVYDPLPTSCFQADLNSSNILLDDSLKFVGLFDFNLVSTLFKGSTALQNIIYVIVGVCGLVNIGILFADIDYLGENKD